MAISSQALQECGEGSTTRARSPDRTVKPHESGRVCSKCKLNPVAPTRTIPYCYPCTRIYDRERYRRNRAVHNERTQSYYRKNRTRVLQQKAEYGQKPDVAERDKARRRERYQTEPQFRAKTKRRRDRYYAANAHRFRARDARRRAKQVLATPIWADAQKIREKYAEAARLTRTTGIRHEVDHIEPIKGRRVSGLHVHFNLRVVSLSENRRKFNRQIQDIV